MKFIFALLVIFHPHIAVAQNLSNSEWVAIQSEHKDGSGILSGKEDRRIKYLFKEKTVLICFGYQYSREEDFYVSDGILNIGKFTKYHIDTATNLLLSLTEISDKLPDEKLYSYIFLNSKFTFDYFHGINKITISPDSVIECSETFSPTYQGNLPEILLEGFNRSKQDRFVTGSIFFKPSGEITKVEIDSATYFTNKEINLLRKKLLATSYNWIMPYVNSSYRLKLDYIIHYMFLDPLLGIQLKLYTKLK